MIPDRNSTKDKNARGDNKLRGGYSKIINFIHNNVGSFQGSPLRAQLYIICDYEITNRYKEDTNKGRRNRLTNLLCNDNIEYHRANARFRQNKNASGDILKTVKLK